MTIHQGKLREALSDAVSLLREVSSQFTREDDLPDDLLPRIDEFCEEQDSEALAASKPEVAKPAVNDWRRPTSYLERFHQAMSILCRAEPPLEMVMAWLDKSKDDHRLQEFAIEHAPAWAQGIAIIDAAYTLADQPTEILTPNGPQVDHERREDDLPDDLLPRIDAFCKEQDGESLAASKPEPVKFLCNGTRFKMAFFDDGDDEDYGGTIHVKCFNNFEKELDGRWVALVAAEDDCHLKYTHPQPQAERVPEGWKLVPVEPTPEMRRAAVVDGSSLSESQSSDVYSAMLAAAPKPQDSKETAA